MLCPQCRRQVGGDGYCPQGHLAAPERVASSQPIFKTEPPAVPSDSAGPAAAKQGRRPLVVSLAFGIVVVAVLGFLAFGPAAGAANLAYTFAAGETHRYSLAMTFDMQAGSLAFGGGTFAGSLEMIMSQTTSAVDEGGVATVRYNVEKLTVASGKHRETIPPPPTPLTVRMTPDGRILDVQGNSLVVLGDSDPVSDLSGLFGPEAFGPILPDRKVSPGESWKIDEEMANPFGDTMRYQGTGTFLGEETINGQSAAVIRSSTDTPFNLRISFGDLAELAGTPAPREVRDVVMTFDGYFRSNMTQSLATGSGSLLSAIGDLELTGTLGLDNVPEEAGDLSAAFIMRFQVTMTSIV